MHIGTILTLLNELGWCFMNRDPFEISGARWAFPIFYISVEIYVENTNPVTQLTFSFGCALIHFICCRTVLHRCLPSPWTRTVAASSVRKPLSFQTMRRTNKIARKKNALDFLGKLYVIIDCIPALWPLKRPLFLPCHPPADKVFVSYWQT